jgi:O-antigen/teichoic acid export membrane protein
MKLDVVILTVGKIIQIVSSLVSIKLLTAYLPEHEVGNYYLILSLFSIFTLVLINPIGMYINRNLNKWFQSKEILNNFFIYNMYLLVVIIVTVIALLIMKAFFDIGKGLPLGELLFITALYIFINTWNSTIIPTFNILMRRISFTVFTVLSQVIALVFSIVLVVFNEPTAINWFYGITVAQLLVAIVAFIYFVNILQENLTLSEIFPIKKLGFKEVLHFAIPIAIATSFMWMQNQSFRLFVEKFLGSEILGFIAVGLAVATNISMAYESLVQQVFYPLFYKEITGVGKRERVLAWQKMASVSIAIYLSLTLFIFIMAPILTHFLLDEKFHQAYIFVFFGAFIELFRMLTNLFSSIAHSEYNTKSLIKPYMLGGLASVVGVVVSCFTSYYEILIPTSLVLSGAITYFYMYKNMREVVGEFQLNKRLSYQTVLLSTPLLLVIPLYQYSTNLMLTVLLLGVFGLYFLFVQYKIYKSHLHIFSNSQVRAVNN